MLRERKERTMATAGTSETAVNGSRDEEKATASFGRDQLKAFIGGIGRLEEEKKALSDDIRDVYAEAKGTGFDVKALRTIVRMRKQDVDERKEHEAILETYMNALGMLV